MLDAPAPSGPYCGHCGKQILRGCLFCSYCGRKHDSATTQESTEPVVWGAGSQLTRRQILQIASGVGALFLLVGIIAFFSGKPDHEISASAESSQEISRPAIAAPAAIPSPQSIREEIKPVPFQLSAEPTNTAAPPSPSPPPTPSLP